MRVMITLLALGLTHTVAAGNIPAELAVKYRPLMTLPVITHPDGSKSLGHAKLFTREGIRVLYLTGDRFEMAYQHGKLISDIFQDGAMPKIRSMIENTARNSFPKVPSVVNPIIKGIYKHYSEAILEHAAKHVGMTVDQYIIEAYGLSAGSGYPVDKIVHAFLAPEILQVILGQQMRGQKNLPPPSAINECTDFAVPPTATSSGGYVIGRNTDYSLNGYFDRFPTVLYYFPTDGAQPYMTVTSAGVHTAGVVGYNNAGLFLGVHTIPTWDTSENGNPVFDVGQYVLRNAKSFDEAIDIFKNRLPGAGWAYTLVSTFENRSATIELSNSEISVRETSGSYHVQSNHFLTSKMKGRNIDINASINEDTQARYERVNQLLESSRNRLDVRSAVDILADKTDPFSGVIRGLGNVVATHFTVTSAVFDTGLQALYFANGLAPTSLTRFVELPLIQNFDPETFSGQNYSTIINDSYHRNNPQQSLAERLYIEAKQAYEIELDAPKASEILKQVVSIDPSNHAYIYVLGLMEIKTRQFQKAQNTFEMCKTISTGHHKLACSFFLAKILASSGQRTDAFRLLTEILKAADPNLEAPLIKATKDNLKKIKRRAKLNLNPDTLSIFMPEADVLSY